MVQIVIPEVPPGRSRKHKAPQLPVFVAEPVTPSNSFVGTEEYIAPVSLSNLISLSAISLHQILLQTYVHQTSFQFLMCSWACRKSLQDKGTVVQWIGGLLVCVFFFPCDYAQPSCLQQKSRFS
jgi:hypothetical protein